jgi:ABC-type multidrug transport system fused ATPase/permease subunit
VIFVDDDRVVAVGKHRDLLDDDRRYRATVTRQTEDEIQDQAEEVLA